MICLINKKEAFAASLIHHCNNGSSNLRGSDKKVTIDDFINYNFKIKNYKNLIFYKLFMQ